MHGEKSLFVLTQERNEWE